MIDFSTLLKTTRQAAPVLLAATALAAIAPAPVNAQMAPADYAATVSALTDGVVASAAGAGGGDRPATFFDLSGANGSPAGASGDAVIAGARRLYDIYRALGGPPDAISEDAVREYLRCYRQPGAMRAGFNLYRAMPQDVADNEAFLAEGKLQMPVLCYGGTLGRGRGLLALDSWQRVASDVRGGVVESCGHWIPEELPDWALAQLLAFFGEEQA